MGRHEAVIVLIQEYPEHPSIVVSAIDWSQANGVWSRPSAAHGKAIALVKSARRRGHPDGRRPPDPAVHSCPSGPFPRRAH